MHPQEWTRRRVRLGKLQAVGQSGANLNRGHAGAPPPAAARRPPGGSPSSEDPPSPHLLSGGMAGGSCATAMAQSSGKSGGYYGRLAAIKSACGNHRLVRRTLAERASSKPSASAPQTPGAIRYVLAHIESEVRRMYPDVPETILLQGGRAPSR